MRCGRVDPNDLWRYAAVFNPAATSSSRFIESCTPSSRPTARSTPRCLEACGWVRWRRYIGKGQLDGIRVFVARSRANTREHLTGHVWRVADKCTALQYKGLCHYQ